MKLSAPFLQLPLSFDAERLAAEIAAIPESRWRPHPQGYPGNDALTLVSTGGDPDSDALGGQMKPTPNLLDCPYLMQAMAAIGATWGRSRLMRLSGDAEVTAHVDVDYYWREHIRVHVPIVTQPTVQFWCGQAQLNMKAGECWVFDTWSNHRVLNDAREARIHLVADTVGGAALWDLMRAARRHDEDRPGWTARAVEAQGQARPTLTCEAFNVPMVMTPWELRRHLIALLDEAQTKIPPAPQLAAVRETVERFLFAWGGAWAAHGDGEGGRAVYRELQNGLVRDLVALRFNQITLPNGISFGQAFAPILGVAVADPSFNAGAEGRAQPGAMGLPPGGFGRPAKPRSFELPS